MMRASQVVQIAGASLLVLVGLIAAMQPLSMGASSQASPSSAHPTSPPVAPPGTMLHLSATASVQTPPDQLVADLVAQATSRSPATAQRQVNTLIASGLNEASVVADVDARAIGYSVYPMGSKNAVWVSQQTLELRGHDGPSLLDLAGRLQQGGFATASLDWQLSEATRRQAHDQATAAALKRLQARAHVAATALGLHVDHLSDVRLDETGEFQPRPGPVMMAAQMATPHATGAPEDVSADVSADAVLRP